MANLGVVPSTDGEQEVAAHHDENEEPIVGRTSLDEDWVGREACRDAADTSEALKEDGNRGRWSCQVDTWPPVAHIVQESVAPLCANTSQELVLI